METKFPEQPLAHLVRDLILKSKDNRRRSEVNDGEVRRVHWSTREEAGLFSRKWTVAPFYPFLVLIVWSWSLVGVSFNMLM